MSKFTFTVEVLSGDGDSRPDKQRHVEAESIFDVPALYVMADYGVERSAILKDIRHGDLSIMGDRRRWFLHQVRFEYLDGLHPRIEEVFLIVTAD